MTTAKPTTMSESEYTKEELNSMPVSFVRSLREDDEIPYAYEHPNDAPEDKYNGL